MLPTQIEGRPLTPRAGFWGKFRPDFFADSVYEIDAEWLETRGLRGLVVDVDNTIMARDATMPGPELRAWVAELRAARVPLLVVSNNWSARVKNIARELDLGVIAPAGKPLASAFTRALGELELPARRTAVVGDQVFTDILGGNRAGLVSIIVPPLAPKDLVHTKALRVLEKLLLKRLSGRTLKDGRWRAI